jgi:hypothetical protein
MATQATGKMAASFGDSAGAWRGSNGFRLMPTDELAHAAASAAVTTLAGGHDLFVTYEWAHPVDGPQEGALLVGSPYDDTQVVRAGWGDSWHQKPSILVLTGSLNGPRLELSAEYGGGWQWMITLEAGSADRLLMTMYNVVPAEFATDEASAGPYPVMVAEFRRVTEEQGGDPACWLEQVCDRCGAFVDAAEPHRCQRT